MWCCYCGSHIPNDGRFCPKCGQLTPLAANPIRKRKKWPIFVIIGSALTLVSLLIVLIFAVLPAFSSQEPERTAAAEQQESSVSMKEEKPEPEAVPEEYPAEEEVTEEAPAAEETAPEEAPAVEEAAPEEAPAVEETITEELPALEEAAPETPPAPETIPETKPVSLSWEGKWIFSDTTPEEAPDNWFEFDFENNVVIWSSRYAGVKEASIRYYPMRVIDETHIEMSQHKDLSRITDWFELQNDGTILRTSDALPPLRSWILTPRGY